mmetsp:Transcript_62058/g.134670  ORF Transcript_62058/g.134670 Transcript_62058/m.134670 type:complete len:313 (+) Transcript_62058:74-1012(+)
MARSRTLPLCLLAAALVASWYSPNPAPSAFLAGTGDALIEGEATPGFAPLDWLHYKVILASHKGYPMALMIGFTAFGNVLLRKECGGKPYPNWIFGWPLGFICYTYPSAVFSDLLFVRDSPRAMSNDNIFFWYTFWFIVIQNSEAAYNFLTRRHVFIILTTWWMADATRASFCFLERAVAHQAVFARGIFQCFVWCSAGPLARLVEANIRGVEKIPKLDQIQPNTANPFKYPLVSMWMLMVAYLLYMTFLTDCHIFSKAEGSLNMVQCGQKHEEVFAAGVYLACGLALARAYWSMGGQAFWGETFCVSCATK